MYLFYSQPSDRHWSRMEQCDDNYYVFANGDINISEQTVSSTTA